MMGLTMPQRAQYYELAYIEAQVEQAEAMEIGARNRLRFWQSMLDAKKELLARVEE